MRARAMSEARRLPVRRDVLLGMGLVAAFAVVVASTSGVVETQGGTVAPALIVAGSATIADVGLLCMPWRRLTTQCEMAFPLLLVAAVIALGLATNGLASNYTGFLTLAFVYVGMTQTRALLPALAVIAVPAWLLCQSQVAAAESVRLGTTLIIWLLIGGVLATRAARDRAQADELIDRANMDGLTGLASRLFLSDQISRSLDTQVVRESSLIVMDLDGFKNVNDMFGHATGDELLIAAARRIQTAVRPSDTCARLGGDEFAVLLQGADLYEATQTAARLVQTMAQPFELARVRAAVTVSVGVAGLHGSVNAQEVLRDADLAMYEAKAGGRNRLALFERDMQERRAARLELETELRKALERDEFELYYQPVVHLQTGAIIGTEALLRWNHPRRGLLAPDQFLNASEEIGVIIALGEWILTEACHQGAEWQPEDPMKALTMAVNVSAPEMLASDFVARVRDVLTTSGLSGELLVLEITERLLLSDIPFVRKRLEELKRLGVRIAIDDFGTGYSSLAYLREFPIDILKIDRSFVTPLGIDPQAVALLRSIMAIANALTLDVVVEGVETETQVELLTGLGCEVAQGFHFARPQRAPILTERLHPSRRRTPQPTDTTRPQLA